MHMAKNVAITQVGK